MELIVLILGVMVFNNGYDIVKALLKIKDELRKISSKLDDKE